jgi:hypothetical protein
VEFESEPGDADRFAEALDAALQRRNPYYRDLLTGSVLRPAVLRPVPPGTFLEAMRSMGKLGGQNKVPRLANDRNLVALLSRAAQQSMVR